MNPSDGAPGGRLRPPSHGVRALLDRLRRDPVGLLTRAAQKLVLGRLRYGRGGDYSAERYWRDRLGRSAGSLRGPGHEGLSDEENARLYADAAEVFRRACHEHGIDLRATSVLDVGCGTGEFTRLCHEEGVIRYLGVDLTDVLFPTLTARFPDFTFARLDVTTDRLEGQYGLVLALDVLEHVVSRDRLLGSLANLAQAVAEGGTLFIALPLAEGSPRPFFYLRLWSLEDLTSGLGSLRISPPVPWRDGWLVVAHKPRSPDAS